VARASKRAIHIYPHSAACVVKLIEAFEPIRDWSKPFADEVDEDHASREVAGTIRLLCSDHREGCHRPRGA
ncbi:MAG: hypothetical protein ABIW79_02370, partial [Gemmatimonas sp.]